MNIHDKIMLSSANFYFKDLCILQQDIQSSTQSPKEKKKNGSAAQVTCKKVVILYTDFSRGYLNFLSLKCDLMNMLNLSSSSQTHTQSTVLPPQLDKTENPKNYSRKAAQVLVEPALGSWAVQVWLVKPCCPCPAAACM